MFTQEPLAYSSLPGFMSEETLSFHYGKHHAGYIAKLNAALENAPEYQNLSLEEVINKSFSEKNMGIFNNAAQHFNHAFFWTCFSSEEKQMPKGLQEKIAASFGSVEEFNARFTQMASTLFGSGWVWLVQHADGSLALLDKSNAGTPVTDSATPLLTIDVWEHAYYIEFRNARPTYIEQFWKFVDWDAVAARLK